MDLEQIKADIIDLKESLDFVPKEYKAAIEKKISELELLEKELASKTKEVSDADKLLAELNAKQAAKKKTVKNAKTPAAKNKVEVEVKKVDAEKAKAVAHKAKVVKEVKDIENDVAALIKKGGDAVAEFNKGRSAKEIMNDAEREALPAGKRVSAQGNVYYENRPDHADADPNVKLEKGGELESITDEIFYPNSKKGRIATSYGDKTKEGLKNLILNDSLTSNEVAEIIFNGAKGSIETGWGRKNIKGLSEMIEKARNGNNELEKGGSIYTDYKNDTNSLSSQSAYKLIEDLKELGYLTRYYDIYNNGKKVFETIIPNESEKGFYKRYHSYSRNSLGTLQNDYLSEEDVFNILKSRISENILRRGYAIAEMSNGKPIAFCESDSEKFIPNLDKSMLDDEDESIDLLSRLKKRFPNKDLQILNVFENGLLKLEKGGKIGDIVKLPTDLSLTILGLKDKEKRGVKIPTSKYLIEEIYDRDNAIWGTSKYVWLKNISTKKSHGMHYESFLDKYDFVNKSDKGIGNSISRTIEAMKGGNFTVSDAQKDLLSGERKGSIMNQYEGKTAEQVWGEWTVGQRLHFLNDHSSEIKSEVPIHKKPLTTYSRSEYKDIPKDVQEYVQFHISEGQYEHGGEIYKSGRVKELKVGQVFELPNGEIIEIKRLFIENIDEDWVEFTRDGKVSESKVKAIIQFLNNWKGKLIDHKEFERGGDLEQIKYLKRRIEEVNAEIKTLGEINSKDAHEKAKELRYMKNEMKIHLYQLDEDDEDVFKFEQGGNIAEGNRQMAINKAIEILHHAEELVQKTKNAEEIPAWVIALIERASTDLYDVTHYLDGVEEMEDEHEEENHDDMGNEHEESNYGMDGFAKGGDLKTAMNTILIFKDGELFKQIRYKTKAEAIGNYKIFNKMGYIDFMTGEPIEGLTFELL